MASFLKKGDVPYTLCEDPFGVVRIKTNSGFLKFYLIFLIVWLGTSSCVFIHWVQLKNQLPLKEESSGFHCSFTSGCQYNFPEILKIILTIVGFSALSLFVSYLCLKLVKLYTKSMAWKAIGFFCFILACLIFITQFIEVDTDLGIFSFILLSGIVILSIKYKKEICDSADIIIQDACKIVCLSSSHFWVTCIEILLLSVTGAFTLFNGFLFVDSHRLVNFSDMTSIFILIFVIINFLGCAWTSFFICGVKSMTLSGSVSTWYSSAKRNEVPKKSMRHSFSTVLKHHLGTVAYGSLISVVLFLMVSVAFISLVSGRKTTNTVSYILLNVLWIYLAGIVMHVGRTAYVVCALRGTDLFTSVKDALTLMKKNIKKVTVTLHLFYLLFAVGVLFANVIPVLIIHIAKYDQQIFYTNFERHGEIILTITIMLTYFIFDVVRTAIVTVLVHDSECSENIDTSSKLDQNYKNLLVKESA